MLVLSGPRSDAPNLSGPAAGGIMKSVYGLTILLAACVGADAFSSKLNSNDRAVGDQFGFSASTDGSFFLAGAPGKNRMGRPTSVRNR